MFDKDNFTIMSRWSWESCDSQDNVFSSVGGSSSRNCRMRSAPFMVTLIITLSWYPCAVHIQDWSKTGNTWMQRKELFWPKLRPEIQIWISICYTVSVTTCSRMSPLKVKSLFLRALRKIPTTCTPRQLNQYNFKFRSCIFTQRVNAT